MYSKCKWRGVAKCRGKQQAGSDHGPAYTCRRHEAGLLISSTSSSTPSALSNARRRVSLSVFNRSARAHPPDKCGRDNAQSPTTNLCETLSPHSTCTSTLEHSFRLRYYVP